MFGIWLFHGLRLHQFVKIDAQALSRISSNLFLNRLA